MSHQEGEDGGFRFGKIASAALAPFHFAPLNVDPGMAKPGMVNLGRPAQRTPQHGFDARAIHGRRRA